MRYDPCNDLRYENNIIPFSYNIAPNSLELVIELFEMLGCRVSYKEGAARWCMVEQKPITVDIQIIEVEDKIISIDKKNKYSYCIFIG